MLDTTTTATMIDDAPHRECSSPWRFDCAHDEVIYAITLDGFDPDSGDVEAPSGWWCPIDLDVTEDAEHVEHYGSPWLIARGNSGGVYWTLAFLTEEGRDAFVNELEREFSAWLGADTAEV